jgi:hypothetical protein
MPMSSELAWEMAQAHREELTRTAERWNRTRQPRRRLRHVLDRLRRRVRADAVPAVAAPAVAAQRV